MYRVINYFTDLSDNGYVYNVGDIYPRPYHKVSEARIRELSSDSNKRHKPLIEEVKEDAPVQKPIVDNEVEPKPKKKVRKKNADGDMSRN